MGQVLSCTLTNKIIAPGGVGGRLIHPQNMIYNTWHTCWALLENGMVSIDFQPKLMGLTLTAEKKGEYEIEIIEHYDDTGNLPDNRGVSCGYTFTDGNTILGADGEEIKLTGQEVLTVKYRDKTEEISIKKLAEENAQ